jgi:copper(I)-binding protein
MIVHALARMRLLLARNLLHPYSTLDLQILRRLLALSAIVAAALVGVSFIHPEPVARVGPISVSHPWARGGARTGQQLSVYLTLANAGATTDRLIAAASDLAERAIIKELELNRGLVSGRELDAFTLPPGSRQTLRPGQAQITLSGLKRVVGPGDLVPLTLRFERAGLVEVKVVVENLGQPDHPEHAPIADRIDERPALRR